MEDSANPARVCAEADDLEKAMSDQQRQNLIATILKSSRARVERVLSRRTGAEPARRQLELGDLEERVLYSATPVPVPADAEMEACVACEAPADSQEAHSEAAEQSTQLVVIDESVADYQQLIDGLVDNPEDRFEVLILDSERDGIEQITEMLSSREDISALHIVSHGQDGSVRLGATTLNADNLSLYAGMLGQWEQSLTSDADILFYGCDLGSSAEGRDFVDSLSILTGADVAASDDLTGHADLGGDWDLEIQVGEVESPLAFTQTVQSSWQHVLAPPTLVINSGATILADHSATFDPSELGLVFDTDVGAADIELTVSVDNGSLTLGDQSDVVLVSGDWFASPGFTISGEESDIAQALESVVYTPDAGWTGVSTVTVTVDDLQSGSATDTFAISVLQPLASAGTEPIAETGGNQFNRGANRGVVRSVSTSLNGTSIVAWRDDQGGQSFWRTMDSNGQLGPLQLLPGANANYASVEIDESDPSGSFIATWTVDNGVDRDIVVQRFAFNGATSGPIPILMIPGDQQNSSIATNAAGDYVITWESPAGVQFQRFDGNDVPIDGAPETVPGSNGGSNPVIGIDADQNLLIGWDDSVGMYYTRYAGGVFAPTQTLSTAQSASGGAIAVNEAGQGVIAWHQIGDGWDVRVQQINPDGTENGTSYRAGIPTGTERNPSVSIDEAGNFAIAWEADQLIEVVNYDWSGSPDGEVRVDLDSSFNSNASVALLDSDNFVVLYTEQNASSDVYARRFTTPVTDHSSDPQIFTQNPLTAYPGQTITTQVLFADADTNANDLTTDYFPSGGIASVTEQPGGGALRDVDVTIGDSAIPGTTSTFVIEVTDTDGTTTPYTVGVDIVAAPAFEVTTTNDFVNGDTSSIAALVANQGGDGISLREAIEAANNTANGATPDVIRFNIAGSGPQVIHVTSGLQAISDAVIIDGTTQGDWVVLDGDSGWYTGLGFVAGSDGSLVTGLIVREFGFSAITLGDATSDIDVAGNRLGSFANDGTFLAGLGNEGGVYIQGNDHQIGGFAATDRNVISGNFVYGVQFDGTASNNQLVGNYIGTDVSGSQDAGNLGDGVRVLADAANNVIDSNVISGNDSTGITFFQNSNNNQIVSNLIGVAADGVSAIGNTTQGIWFVDGSHDNVVGGSLADANTIANSGDAGIALGAGATGNSLRFNEIRDNVALGIDLGSDGSNDGNDNLDGDFGANQMQNYPVLQSAVVSGSDLTVIGSLNSTPNTTFEIDLYASATADATGHGEAERHIGSITVTTDPSGEVNFTHGLTGVGVLLGEAVTATATDAGRNTSEFSMNVIASSGTENIAPINIGPGFSRTAVDTPLVLSSAFANHLRIVDNDAGVGVMRLSLDVSHGSLTLSQTGGLSFVTGDGFQDSSLEVFGTLADLNAALDGLVYTPEPGFVGVATLAMDTSDEGNSGVTGGVKTDLETMQISVGYELQSTEAIVVNETAAGNQQTSAEGTGSKNAVSLLPDGSYVVVWTDPTNDADSSTGVYARILNADGTEKVSEFQVASAPNGDEFWASVDSDDQGRFVVVWTQPDGDQTGVFMRRFNADGSPLDASEIRVNTVQADQQEDAHVAVNGDGRGVIVWEGRGTNDPEGVFARTFSIDGGFDGGQFQVNDVDRGSERDIRVAINEDGHWVATYAVGGNEIRFRQFDDSNNPGVDTAVANGGAFRYPTVGINDDGSFVVAYGRVVVGPDRIDYVTYSATGVRGQSGGVNDFSGLGEVAIASDGTGHHVLAYEAHSFFEVNLRRIGLFADGTVAQATTPSVTIHGGGSRLPSVDIRDQYNMVFVWTEDSGDGSGTAIMARTTGTLQAEGLVLSTEGNAAALGETWVDSSLVSFGGNSLNLGGTTSGAFANLGSILSGAGLNGVSVIQNDIVIGPDASPVQLRKGDLIASIDQTTTTLLGVTYEPEDLLLVRSPPGTDSLLISVLLSGTQPAQAITLVEQDTLVGDTLVKAGDLLYVTSGGPDGQDIYLAPITSADGTGELLIRGSDIGIDNQITAIDVAEQSMTIGGQTVAAGSLVLSTAQGGMVGDNGQVVRNEDLFALNVSTTTLTSGTTSAAATILFEGGDVELNGGPGESVDAVTLFAGATVNQAPELSVTSPMLGTTDEDTASDSIRVHSITSGVTSDINGDWVGLAVTGFTGNGQWQYALDDGALWVPITSATPTSALLLSPTAQLRYMPDTLNGETPTLTYQAWDQTSGTEGGFADATANGGSTAFSTNSDTASLTVTPLNDAPSVTASQTFSVSEAAGNGTTFGFVQGADPDSGDTLQDWTIVSGDEGVIGINSTTGELYIVDSTTLDYEDQNQYTLTVSVGDGALTSMTRTVIVDILDENDNAPIIDSGASFTIAEDITNGSEVWTASATDADTNTVLMWSLADNAGGRFTIDSSTGVVTVVNTSLLDYEMDQSHTVIVVADDGLNPSTPQTVTINLTDVNDTAPVIDPGQTFTVSEGALNGFVLGAASSSDADGVGFAQDWVIVGGNTDNIFAIDPDSGAIVVDDNTDLDYDTTNSYTLTLEVGDGVNTSMTETVTITVTDVNDLAPVIDLSQTFNATEGDANGTSLGFVTGVDPDTGVLQNWQITDVNSPFAIDAATGELTISDTTLLDFESQQTYTATVVVNDGAFDSVPQTITVNLADANDETPTVTPSQTFDVSELDPTSTSIGFIAGTDPDTVGTLQNWTILSGDDGVIGIDAATGELFIADDTNLDFEVKNQYTLTVSVGDGVQTSATETVIVTITDENDNAPVVDTGLNFTVPEDIASGLGVGTVTATDADTNTTYTWSLTDNAGGRFSIDPGTGELLVANTTLLDFETATTHTVEVMASDGLNDSTPQTVTINLTDVNDTAPVVDLNQSFTIAEDQANNSIVGTVTASDLDTNTVLSWALTNDAGGRFTIDQDTGEILVLDTSLLDFETSQSHTVTVVTNDGLQDSVPEDVTINLTDVNDTAPVVDSGQSFTIAEGLADASVVGTLTASDADTNTVLEWSLTDDAGGRFDIDQDTGEILVLNSSLLDFETTQSHTVTVVANDGVQSSTPQTVTINLTDVNDNAPVVGPGQSFTIAEGILDATGVGTVAATDLDTNTTLTWAIIDTAGGRFDIDPGTGEIVVADASLLDFEAAQVHTVTVVADDGIQSSTPETVTINITDVNDNAPVIDTGQSFTVAEDTANGGLVGSVTASDVDTNTTLTWTLVADAGGRFTIDPNTGDILVLDVNLLDFEGSPTHTVGVVANDGVQNSSQQSVVISLTDVNDVAPTIDPGQEFTVSEDAAVGFVLGKATSSDPDTVGTAQNWTIVSGNTDSIFSIDAATGAISVSDTTGLDRETTASYTLTLQVEDGVNASATETVTINVTDVNDTAPTIVSPLPGAFTILENSSLGTTVGTLTALDLDTVGSLQKWQIAGGDPNGVFQIDPETGEISVADSTLLDHELQPVYTLDVLVSDGVQDSATGVVQIAVADLKPELTVSGGVWEDIDGDGLLGTNNRVERVRVDLYRDTGDGIANNADVLVRSVFTTATGYEFTDLAEATYFVVVDSRTVTSTTDLSATGNIWAEQTYGSAGSLQGAGHTTSDGFLYGGRFATRSDDASTLETAEHVTRVDLDTSETDLHFGFSFNVVTNTLGGDLQDDDLSSGRTVQGSLRQFIDNANAIDGGNRMRFVPVESTNSGDGTNDWWKLTVTHALPQLTDAGTIIDGTAWSPTDPTQVLNPNDQILGRERAVGLGADGIAGTADDVRLTGVDAPELEIANDRSVNAVASGLSLQANDIVVQSISINGFGLDAVDDSGNIKVGTDAGSNYTGIQIRDNVIGSSAGEFARPEFRNRVSNIVIEGADAGVIENNLIGYSDVWGVRVENNADSWTIENNEFVQSSTKSAGQDAIDLQRGSGDAIIVGNFIKNTGGSGIDMFRSDGGNFISDNTILDSGRLNVEVAGIRVFGTGNTIQQNVIDGNFALDGSGGAGIIVVGDYTPNNNPIAGSTENTISRNYFGQNAGPSIDLVAGGETIVVNQRGDGLDTTPGYDPLSANRGIDAPVLIAATSVGTDITLTGQAEPNSTVEVYSALADGVGSQFIGQAVTDANGEFTFVFGARPGVIAVTANVTDPAGNTSEFGSQIRVNAAPQITSPSDLTVAENSTIVAQLEARDIEQPATTLTWNITGGADASLFILSPDGQLELVAPQDFETGPNQFEVEVTVTDVVGATDVRTLQVEVTPVNDHSPTFTTPASVRVSESQTTVIDVDAIDGDAPVQTLTYSVGGTDASHFTIDPATGNLTFDSARDFENPTDANGDNVYEIQVFADDGNGATTSQTLLVTVTDENDSTPVLTSSPMQLPEDSPNGTIAAVVGASDADTVGDAHQYTLLDDFAGLFSLDATTGELTVQNSSLLDFEGTTSFEVPIRVSDGVNQSTDTVLIEVTNANEGPFDLTLDNTTVPENTPGAVVGTVAVRDLDAGDSHTFTVNDNRFEVDGTTLKLKDSVSLDAEAVLPTNVRITATDADGLRTSQTYLLTVQNENDAPQAISLSNNTVLENVAGAVVGEFTVTDPDAVDSHTFTVDNTDFEVVDGMLQLRSDRFLDYEADEVVDVTVTAIDEGGARIDQAISVRVQDHQIQSQNRVITQQEDAPAFEVDLNEMFNDSQLGRGLSFSLSGNDNNLAEFSLSDEGFLTVTPLADANGENVITVTGTTAEGESVSADLMLSVAEVNDAPQAGNSETQRFTGPLVSSINLEAATDVDGDALTVQLADAPTNGTVVLSPDGAFEYIPDGTGSTDSFTYVVTDGVDTSEQVRVELSLAAVAAPTQPAPVIDTPVEVVTTTVDTAEVDVTEEVDLNVDVPDTTPTVAAPQNNGGTNEDATDERQAGNIFDPTLIIDQQQEDEDVSIVPGFLPFQREAVEENRVATQRGGFEDVEQVEEAVARKIARETAEQIVARRIQGPANRVVRQQVEQRQNEALDKVTQDLGATRIDQVVLGTAGFGMGGLSVGYIIWLLRGGSLVASMLTSIPAWRMVDPLPILDFLDGDDEDQESLDQLIERNKKLISGETAANEGK